MTREELIKQAYAYGASVALQEIGMDKQAADATGVKLAMGAPELKAAIMQLLAQGKAGLGRAGGAMSGAAQSLGQTAQGVGGAMSGAAQRAGGAVSGAAQSLGQKAQGMGSAIGQKAQGMGGSAMDALEAAKSRASGMGQDMAGFGNQAIDFSKANPGLAALLGGGGAALGAGGAMGVNALMDDE